MGVISDLIGAGSSLIAGKAKQKAAHQYQKDQMARIDGLDWEPEYASDHAPTYQRSQSPVARAFLESMLTDANPATTFSGRHGAQQIQQGQQRRFGQQYGDWNTLQQQQRALDADTPWAVKPMTRQVKDHAADDVTSGRYKTLAAGFTPEEAQRLQDQKTPISADGRPIFGMIPWSPEKYRKIMHGKGGW
jgi:hypothetical protein